MRARLALAAVLGLLWGCHSAPINPGSARLELSVSPPSPASLVSGTIVRVTAQPMPKAEMAWVSGTVKIFGAKPIALRPGEDGTWSFKTMVPPMFTVPAGTYEVRSWGRTTDGQPLEGTLTYEVK